MKKLIFKTQLSPGDILTLTAAVESLHSSFPGEYQTDVRTNVPDIWSNNPHLTPLDENSEDVETLEVHYENVHKSNQTLTNFLSGYTEFISNALQKTFRLTTNRPHIYLSDEEKSWAPQPQVLDPARRRVPFWLICAGTKLDFTVKQWPVEYYQEVVNKTSDLVQWVQIGAIHINHHHEKLNGVVNLLGQTSLRELMRLSYQSCGGLGPTTLLTHLSAAFQKPYVCLMGGREPVTFCQYQLQHTFHCRHLPCCREGACWSSRVMPLVDPLPMAEEKPSNLNTRLCSYPLQGFSRPTPKCMAEIKPEEVIHTLRRIIPWSIRSPKDGWS